MAAVAGPATPQRPLPGAFMATPAPQGATIFASNAASLRQTQAPPAAEAPSASMNTHAVSLVERAARTISEMLAIEQRFPELESYVTQGVSGEYDIPTSPAWLPFQKLKMHDLPPRLLEQVNHSGMGMEMGVFPPLRHAWVALDNCLYLWDYSLPNPELIGFEENTQPITAVKLVPPKPGVFVADIRHMIVICTSSEMLLLGVAIQNTPTGAQTIALYNTRMSIPIKGLGVHYIVASQRTGRIFFTGSASDDIFEFQYQQEEGWFRGKCSRICHTKSAFDFVSGNVKAVGQYFGPQIKTKIYRQMVIDDTRNLMYTLSNTSEVRVWLIKERLEQSLMRPLSNLLQGTGHFSSRTELLTGKDVELCSINTIPAVEARKISLLATTNTGCRLYLSVTRGYGNQADAQNPPASMQVLHIRFPPSDPNSAPSQPGQQSLSTYSTTPPSGQVNTSSRLLTPTTMAYRYSPGYFLAVQPIAGDANQRDRVFCSAPDSARLKNPADASPTSARFAEFGQWIDLPAQFMQVMPITGDFAATGEPTGFGNELAVQFDSVSSEFAIVTTVGVQTMRRRRLVDVFAGVMRYGSSDDEGQEGDIKRFVRLYGRGETAATALAVACGQGLDVADSRVANVTDPEVIEKARKAFIEHGGKPDYNPNAVVDHSAAPIDGVRPSPRHEGIALYISRLVRALWKAPVIRQNPNPGAAPESAISLEKLRAVQRDLTSLRDFLDKNRSFIEGLAGPQALSRANTRQEEIALQGEHRAMTSLVQLIESISEGISFVLVLFDERIGEILAILSEESRRRARELTFEALFVTPLGRDLAKELVKAIVNRNIANGSNVDTVAEALRRRCGSFCSAEDVVIFKAQEQVKRASEAGSQSENGRMLLNESQRLFQKVAGSLSADHLKWAIEMYVEMSFYAGAIQLCLAVAAEKDKAKRALSWLRDGMPRPDARTDTYDACKACYELVFATITELDRATAKVPQILDGQFTLTMKRRSEAYDIINDSEDIVFLTCLYDWYVSKLGEPDRLLEIDNPYVVEYLRKRSQDKRIHADLLWRYFAHHSDFLQAASVQLDVARSHFELSLEERIGYLSHARTNASTRQSILTDARQSKQKLLREISDLLEIANVQDEILQRMKEEPRLSNDRRPEILRSLNGHILSVEELFNGYADNASYHDICILLYQVADHRNPADIMASWQQLINQTDMEAPVVHGRNSLPYEAVGEKVMELGRRLHIATATFPIQILLPMLERYALTPREQHPPQTWAVDIFLALDIPHETLLPVLEQMYYGNEHPFVGSKRKIIAAHMVYLLQHWFQESEKSGERSLFGSEENASIVQDCLATLLKNRADLEPQWRRVAENLAADVSRATR